MKGAAIRRLLCAAAVLGGAVLIGYRGGTASWLLFWSVLTVPLLALVYRLLVLRRLRASFRTEAQRALHGERLPCTLTLVNDSPLPLPEVRVRMISGKVDCGKEEIVCSLRPREIRELPFEPVCRYCGDAPAGAEDVCAGDLFGLFERHIRAEQTVQVLPRRQRVQALLAAPPRETERQRTAQLYFGDRVPDGQLRPYVPGDDVRRIHWKASALQGRPIMRNVTNDPKSGIVLLCDARDALPEGEPGWIAADSVIEGTLCIADYYLRHSIPLRVIPDEKRAMNVFTASDYPRLYRICTERFFSGTERPDELLEKDVAANGVSRGYILLTWEVDEAFLRRVERCIGLGAEVTVVYIGESERIRAQAAAVRRLPFHQVTAQRDIFTVLGGAGGEGGAS